MEQRINWTTVALVAIACLVAIAVTFGVTFAAIRASGPVGGDFRIACRKAGAGYCAQDFDRDECPRHHECMDEGARACPR